MDTNTGWFMTLWVVGLSHGLPLAEEQQSDTSVRQLVVKLEAEINANMAEIKQLEDTLTDKLQGKAVLTSDTAALMATLSTFFDRCAENQKVVFDAVERNQLRGYDNRFRAPKTGTDQISTTISSSPLRTGYHVALVKKSVTTMLGIYLPTNS